MSEQIKEFMYINRVQQVLDCSKDFVYGLIKGGELDAIRLGKRAVRVSKASLLNYIEKSKIDPQDFFG